MKTLFSFFSRRKEAFFLSLAGLLVSFVGSAQSKLDIGETLLTESETALENLIDGFISFAQVIIIIGGIYSLVMVIYKTLNSDREAAQKFGYWLIGFVVGFALLAVLGTLR